MHLSGVLVLCKPPATGACLRELEQLSNIDVYVTDEAAGRIVIVMETETLDAQEDGLRRVQRLPNVVAAELVYHYFGDVEEMPADPAGWIEGKKHDRNVSNNQPE